MTNNRTATNTPAVRAQRVVDQAKDEILSDAADHLMFKVSEITSFADLYEHVDANEYLIEDDQRRTTPEENMLVTRTAAAALDAWIARGGLKAAAANAAARR